jgi:hypothetical protein
MASGSCGVSGDATITNSIVAAQQAISACDVKAVYNVIYGVTTTARGTLIDNIFINDVPSFPTLAFHFGCLGKKGCEVAYQNVILGNAFIGKNGPVGSSDLVGGSVDPGNVNNAVSWFNAPNDGVGQNQVLVFSAIDSHPSVFASVPPDPLDPDPLTSTAFPFAPTTVDPQKMVVGVNPGKYGFQIAVDVNDIFRGSKNFYPGPYLWTGIGKP